VVEEDARGWGKGNIPRGGKKKKKKEGRGQNAGQSHWQEAGVRCRSDNTRTKIGSLLGSIMI